MRKKEEENNKKIRRIRRSLRRMSVTLKQTVREKGRVTRTRASERTVRAQPQTPIPGGGADSGEGGGG